MAARPRPAFDAPSVPNTHVVCTEQREPVGQPASWATRGGRSRERCLFELAARAVLWAARISLAVVWTETVLEPWEKRQVGTF